MNPTGIALIGAALGAGLVAGTAGWFARGLVADHMQIPAIVEQQDRLCEAATEKAAADAVGAEQLRQFRIGERATQAYIEQARLAADDAEARIDVLEMEIKAYEDRLNAEGDGFCALDAAALDLLGLHKTGAEPDRGRGSGTAEGQGGAGASRSAR